MDSTGVLRPGVTVIPKKSPIHNKLYVCTASETFKLSHEIGFFLNPMKTSINVWFSDSQVLLKVISGKHGLNKTKSNKLRKPDGLRNSDKLFSKTQIVKVIQRP